MFTSCGKNKIKRINKHQTARLYEETHYVLNRTRRVVGISRFVSIITYTDIAKQFDRIRVISVSVVIEARYDGVKSQTRHPEIRVLVRIQNISL